MAVLLAGAGPLVICLGHSVTTPRLPAAWRAGVEAGRVLVVAPLGPGLARTRAATAGIRNQVAAALAPALFVAYAAPGSKTAALAAGLAAQGKPLATFASPHTQPLLALGAQPVPFPLPPAA